MESARGADLPVALQGGGLALLGVDGVAGRRAMVESAAPQALW